MYEKNYARYELVRYIRTPGFMITPVKASLDPARHLRSNPQVQMLMEILWLRHHLALNMC